MPNYDFTVTFNLPDSEPHPSHYVDILHVNGCDDALVGVGRLGKIALNFTRNASSAAEAVHSAIADVKRAIPEANLIDVSPDLISITDVAKHLGCTRQNIRNLLITGGANSPHPVLPWNSLNLAFIRHFDLVNQRKKTIRLTRSY